MQDGSAVGIMNGPGGGRHVQCKGKTARVAAVDHFKQRRAIVTGCTKQLKMNGVCEHGYAGQPDVQLHAG